MHSEGREDWSKVDLGQTENMRKEMGVCLMLMVHGERRERR